MIDLKNYKILKYHYPFPTEKLGEMVWDKMTSEESRWAIQLTVKGINDTGGNEESSWDIFFLDNKLKDKIDNILNKYKVPYSIEDETEVLLDNKIYFDEDFIIKLDNFLDNNLSVDDVLDRILEVGIENLTVFEKYYLNKHKDDE